MHKNYFHDLIIRKPELYAAILKFNGLADADNPEPARRLFAAAHVEIDPDMCLDLWKNPPSRAHLLAAARTGAFWDFAEESRCLALLEQETLDCLGRFYGAGVHAPAVARVVLGREVAELRAALGEACYLFAVQRAQYRHFAGQELFADRQRELPLSERILLHGREALGIVAAAWPPELQNRASCAQLSDLALTPELQRSVWQDMKKTLLREVSPAWTPCFD